MVRFIAKQQLCTCFTLSCTLLYRRSTTTTWNCPISLFLKGVITRQLFLNTYFNHIYSPLEFYSTKIHQHLTNWTRWNNSHEFWNSVNSLFKRRFRYRRHRRCFLRLGATKVSSFFPCLFTVQEVFNHGKVTKNLDLTALLFLGNGYSLRENITTFWSGYVFK